MWGFIPQAQVDGSISAWAIAWTRRYTCSWVSVKILTRVGSYLPLMWQILNPGLERANPAADEGA